MIDQVILAIEVLLITLLFYVFLRIFIAFFLKASQDSEPSGFCYRICCRGDEEECSDGGQGQRYRIDVAHIYFTAAHSIRPEVMNRSSGVHRVIRTPDLPPSYNDVILKPSDLNSTKLELKPPETPPPTYEKARSLSIPPTKNEISNDNISNE